MGLVLDIIIIVIIAATVFLGYKKGLVRALLGFASFIAAFAAARMFSGNLAAVINDRYVYGAMSRGLAERFAAIVGNGSADSVKQLIDDKPSEFMNLLGGFNVNVSDAKEYMGEAVQQGAQNLNQAVAEKIVAPLAQSVSYFIAFAAIFFGTLIIFFIISKILGLIVKLPVLRTFDKIGGLALGIAFAFLYATLFAAVASFALPYIVSSTGASSIDDVLAGSALFRYFHENNVMAFLFRSVF